MFLPIASSDLNLFRNVEKLKRCTLAFTSGDTIGGRVCTGTADVRICRKVGVQKSGVVVSLEMSRRRENDNMIAVPQTRSSPFEKLFVNATI